MPVLSNTRHERFAQELAKGKSAAEAYELAGYAANDGNCIRLKGNERVAARVAELQSAIAAVVVEETAIDRARVLKELALIALAPLGDDDVKTSDKRSALVDYAKIEGWIVDKHELTGADGGPIETKDVSARDIIERRIAGLSARGGEEGHTRKPH